MGLKEASAAFLPLATFAFGKPALVAFLATLPILFVSESPPLCFREDFSRSVIQICHACQRSSDSFFDELDDFNTALVAIVG